MKKFIFLCFVAIAAPLFSSHQEQKNELIDKISETVSTKPHLPGCACQQQACAIYNGTLIAAQKNDAALLSLRLVQADKGLRVAWSKIYWLLPSTAVSAYLDLWVPGGLLTSWSLISFGNLWRYYEAYQVALKALKTSLPSMNKTDFDNLISDLLAIGYESRRDKIKIDDVLIKFDIDTESLWR